MMSSRFRLFYHIGVLTLAVVWAFVWLRTPSLSHYSLQLFGAAIVGYFVLKRLNQADFWQLLPSPISLEMALATLAFLLVIGATGNIHSPLFPLSFVHLFFLVISAETVTALIIMLEILLFHYSLTPQIGRLELSYLSSLPIVMSFFFIAKDQFSRLARQQLALGQKLTEKTATIQKLQRVDQALEGFITRSLGMSLPPETSPQPAANLSVTQVEIVQVEPLIDLDLNQTEAEKIATEITETLNALDHESSEKV